MGADLMIFIPMPNDEISRRIDEMVDIFGEATHCKAEALVVRRSQFKRHMRRAEFRAVGGLSPEGDLLGFAYGHLAKRGQWWRDYVGGALSKTARQYWLSNCFLVVELHVRPSMQGCGLGTWQLRELLRTTGAVTTLLTTPEADPETSRAWRLYRRAGFVDVLRGLKFPGDRQTYALLGAQLPLQRSAAG